MDNEALQLCFILPLMELKFEYLKKFEWVDPTTKQPHIKRQCNTFVIFNFESTEHSFKEFLLAIQCIKGTGLAWGQHGIFTVYRKSPWTWPLYFYQHCYWSPLKIRRILSTRTGHIYAVSYRRWARI